jgi:hypothetical protein
MRSLRERRTGALASNTTATGENNLSGQSFTLLMVRAHPLIDAAHKKLRQREAGFHHQAITLPESDPRQTLPLRIGAQNHAVSVFKTRTPLTGRQAQGICAVPHLQQASL